MKVPRNKHVVLVALAMLALYVVSGCVWAKAADTPTAAPPSSSDFALEPSTEDHPQERKELEKILKDIETQWNTHNLEGVMGYYSDDYVNNDGLDKKAVSALTQDFWRTYPDAKSTSNVREIRIDGSYATVESRDVAIGTTAREMPGIGTSGELQSVSEGQLYLKRTGENWKITGDRIDYEKVKLAFGLAKTLHADFSAPEQVKSGHQYTARLDLDLLSGLTAVGSITSQPLQYPQTPPSDIWRPLEGTTLERVLTTNNKNRNELLMATVGVTNASHSSLAGLAFLTRRLNVVPNMESDEQETAATTSAATHEALTHAIHK
jgi:hypothetical protein